MHTTYRLMVSCTQITDSNIYGINLLTLSKLYGKSSIQKHNVNSMKM